MVTKKESKPVIAEMLKLLDEADTRSGEPAVKQRRPKVAKPTHKVKDGIVQNTRLIDGILVKSASGFTPDERVLKARILASRGGPREPKIPQEQLDLARSIAAEEKLRQVHGYRKRVISRLLKEHGIDAGTESNLEKYYL